MAQAATSGLTPAQFWVLTPRELVNYWEGQTEAERIQWKRALWHAWHTEAFQRTKHLPSLARLMGRIDGGRREEASVEELHQKILVAHEVMTVVAQQKKAG